MNKKLFLIPIIFLLLVTSVLGVATAPTTSDILAYYSLDNADLSGSTCYDLTNNDYDLTISGATTGSTGIYNQAYSFDGSGDKLRLASGFPTLDDFSISFWIKPDISNNGNIISLGYNDASSIVIYMGGASHNLINIYDADSTTNYVDNSLELADDVWQHVVLVRSGADLDVSIDGVLEHTFTTFSTDTTIGTGVLEFGYATERNLASAYFTGLLDEILVADVEFNANNVEYLYNSGNPGEAQQYDFSSTESSFDITNTNSINNFNVTFNSTTYSTTNGTINTGIDSSEEFSIIGRTSENYYFNITYTDYNISEDLSITFIEYPKVEIYNLWNDSVLSDFNVSYDNITISDVGGVAHLFLNETKNITIQKENYFSKTITHNFTDSNDLNTSLYQSVMWVNITERFSGNQIKNWTLLNGSRVLINTTSNVDVFYPNSGEYDNIVLHSNSGDFNDRNIDGFNVSLLEQNTIFYELLPTEMNITAKNILSDVSINNFSITYSSINSSHSGSYTCTDGDIIFGVINGDTYNITIDADSYALYNNTINKVISGNTDHTFYLYTNNSINFEVRWEDNNSLVTNLTSIVLTGLPASYSFNTSNGTYYKDNLIDGTYSVKASINGLEKYYSITVADRSHQDLTIYFADNYDNVTFLFQDKNTGIALEGVFFSLSRYINGTLTVVSSKLSDITGTVKVKYVSGTYYSISGSKDGYAVKTFSLDPIESELYIVKMESSATQVLISDGVSVYYSPKTFTNGSNDFSLTINSPLGLLSSYWLNVSYPGGYNNFSGSNSIGEVFSFDVNISNPNMFDTVKVQYYYLTSLGGTDAKTFYHPINFVNASSSSWGGMGEAYSELGIFERIMLVVLAVILVAGFGYLVAGFGGSLVMGLLVYVFFAVTGFIPLWIVLVPLFIGGVLIFRGGVFG